MRARAMSYSSLYLQYLMYFIVGAQYNVCWKNKWMTIGKGKLGMWTESPLTPSSLYFLLNHNLLSIPITSKIAHQFTQLFCSLNKWKWCAHCRFSINVNLISLILWAVFNTSLFLSVINELNKSLTCVHFIFACALLCYLLKTTL